MGVSFLSVHPEVDDGVAAGVEEGEEEDDGVDVAKVARWRVSELHQLKPKPNQKSTVVENNNNIQMKQKISYRIMFKVKNTNSS